MKSKAFTENIDNRLRISEYRIKVRRDTQWQDGLRISKQ